MSKLLINIVLDNSASVKGEKITKLKEAIKNFDDKINSLSLNDKIEYSLTIFKGFNAVIEKTYETTFDVENLYVGGIPFVNAAITKGINDLLTRVDKLQQEGVELYKPWTVLLLDGENFDSLDETVDLLLKVMKAGRMSYFPFALADNEMDKSLGTLRKLKPFTIIKDQRYEDLFNWLFTIAKSRVEAPANQPISIAPNSFEGWTIK